MIKNINIIHKTRERITISSNVYLLLKVIEAMIKDSSMDVINITKFYEFVFKRRLGVNFTPSSKEDWRSDRMRVSNRYPFKAPH